MASSAVWGIDVGQFALRAMKLRHAEDGRIEIVAFDVVEYPKILSQPDAEPAELIGEALEKFISRNELQGDEFVIGVPGQQTFARFCKLPPVEAKKIPDIVKFEASQQIPFEMDDVVWDYEVFQEPDSPDIEVGIFAMRKDLIRQHLDHFSSMKVAPQAIQTMPSALYNFYQFDHRDELEPGAATVIIDVGAQNTDLVIVEPNSAWTRNIPLGGNRFTEELVKKFKLSFAKAEQLKRSAATSKHARQIFQAMRPIFAELVAEVQRSLGFFGSTHRDVELKHVVACGNAFRLPGLQKYLENNLTITGGVKKFEGFQRVVDSPVLETPLFKEHVMALPTAYGLAIQGLGEAKISANLLPPELARAAAWRRKRPWFVAAAACTALAAFIPWTRISLDRAALAGNASLAQQSRSIVNRAQELQRKYNEVAGGNETERQRLERLFELTADRDLVPRVVEFVLASLPAADPALLRVGSPDELKQLIESNPGRYARTNRKQILIDALEVTYHADIDAAERPQGTRRVGGGAGAFGRSAAVGGAMGGPRGRGVGGGYAMTPAYADAGAGGESGGGFMVVVAGRILYGTDQSQAATLLFEEFYKSLYENGQRPGMGFYVPDKDPKSRDLAQQRNLDPTLPIEKVYAGGGPAIMQASRFGPAPGQAVEETGPTVLFPDPVTGEDMKDDWQFEFAFKVKLGEPPKPEGQDGDGEAAGG